MIRVNEDQCTGCGKCVDACPRQAITLTGTRPVINEQLCAGCLACVRVCETGAIYQVAPVEINADKGGAGMYFGYGRGIGFRGSSPPWPYVGRGRGGLPRCWYPGLPNAGVPWTSPVSSFPTPFQAGVTQEQEMNILRSQADALKRQLQEIERRIQVLEKKD